MTDAAKTCNGPAGLLNALLLSPEDNVVIVRANMQASASILIDDEVVTLDRDVPIGFKLARVAICKGDRIIKYGAPIGSATTAIAKGAVIHLHNMKSDYLPTYTPEGDNFTNSEGES